MEENDKIDFEFPDFELPDFELPNLEFDLSELNIDTIFILIGVFIVISTLLYLYYKKHYNNDNKYIETGEVPDVKWPFLNLKDENGKNVNMLVIRGYLEYNGENTKQFIKYLNQGIKFIGCSSHQSFPRICNNPHGGCHKAENIKVFGKDVEDYVLGWCHCFREPEKYIKSGIPKILISESDFNSEKFYYDPNLPKIYDYISIQPKDNDQCTLGWHGHYKNWPLAEKCIKVFSDELGLKGIVIGRGKCPVNIKNKHLVHTTDLVPHNELMKYMTQSRFILLPNTEEASPRVLTESFTMNTPAFINRDILGGWKYINDKTGLFFTENTIKESVIRLMNNIKMNTYSPREYYLNNYGMKNSGKKLRDFLKSINPELSECEHVRFEISN